MSLRLLESTQVTTQDFIDRYGDDHHYELIDGALIDVEPTGYHEQVAGWLGRKLNVAIDQQQLPYIISGETIAIAVFWFREMIKFNR